MIPALVVIGVGFSPTRALVLSQVFLSFGIPFALIPLVVFTSSRSLMGPLANRRLDDGGGAAWSPRSSWDSTSTCSRRRRNLPLISPI